MSYRFAIIRSGHITEQHVQDIVKQLALTADGDIISEKSRSLVVKYGATPYFSTAKLIFQLKTGSWLVY